MDAQPVTIIGFGNEVMHLRLVRQNQVRDDVAMFTSETGDVDRIFEAREVLAKRGPGGSRVDVTEMRLRSLRSGDVPTAPPVRYRSLMPHGMNRGAALGIAFGCRHNGAHHNARNPSRGLSN